MMLRNWCKITIWNLGACGWLSSVIFVNSLTPYLYSFETALLANLLALFFDTLRGELRPDRFANAPGPKSGAHPRARQK